MVNIEKKGQVN